MKLSERVLDAMSGIDEKLLKDSEEYTAKRKTFDFRILIMSAAVILLAVIILPRMPRSGAAAPAAGMEEYEAVNDREYPAEAAEAEEEKSAETDTAYGLVTVQMTEELQKALQEEKAVTIAAEPEEAVPEDILQDLCTQLQDKGYEVFIEEGKLIIRTEGSSFDTEDLPAGYAWRLDLKN